jgi:hypothetical protein
MTDSVEARSLAGMRVRHALCKRRSNSKEITMTRSMTALAAVLVLGAGACDKSAKDTQETADKAQAQANTEITNAQVQANDKSNSAQATADKKIAAAQRDFDTTREDYRHDVQTKLDALDQKLTDLDAKAKTAPAKTKADLDAKVSSLHVQRDAFGADFRSLASVSLASWDSTKVRLDKEWSELKSAADKI